MVDLGFPFLIIEDFNYTNGPQEKRGVYPSLTILVLRSSGILLVRMVWWTLVSLDPNSCGATTNKVVLESGNTLTEPLL